MSTGIAAPTNLHGFGPSHLDSAAVTPPHGPLRKCTPVAARRCTGADQAALAPGSRGSRAPLAVLLEPADRPRPPAPHAVDRQAPRRDRHRVELAHRHRL